MKNIILVLSLVFMMGCVSSNNSTLYKDGTAMYSIGISGVSNLENIEKEIQFIKEKHPNREYEIFLLGHNSIVITVK